MNPNEKYVSFELAQFVCERLEGWVKTAGVTWAEVETTDRSLSKSSIKRIKSPPENTPEEKWRAGVGRLVGRLEEIAKKKGIRGPDDWDILFEKRLPRPPGMPITLPFAVFNTPQIQKDGLAKLADPLIERLLNDALSAQGIGNVWKASGLFNQAGRLLEMSRDWDRAAGVLRQLAALNEKTGDFHFHADALLREGQAYLHAGNAKLAGETFQRGLDVIHAHRDRSPPSRIKLRLLNYLALTRLSLNQPTEAWEMLLKESLPLATDTGSPASVASVHNRLANVALELENYDHAFEYILSAIKGRFSLDMLSEVARSLTILGRIHAGRKETVQAILIWELSIHLQRMLKDHEGFAQTNLLLGKAFLHLAAGAVTTASEVSLEFRPGLFTANQEFQLLKAIAEKAKFQGRIVLRDRAISFAETYLNQCAHAEKDAQRYSAEAEQILSQLTHAKARSVR